MNALLALEDGRTFSGQSFGHSGTTTGEICFNTSMTGYQEIITDPSYSGQIVTLTYPQIGNYGVIPEDNESEGPQIRGLIIEELAHTPSNWRSRQSLTEWLAEHEVIGLSEIDTRALTKHLRTQGAMRACLTTELSEAEAIAVAKNSPSMLGLDLVSTVTTPEAYTWSGHSNIWRVPNYSRGETEQDLALPEPRYRVVAYDFGVKRNILRRLRQEGMEVEVVPASTPAQEILARQPDGIFLSNGPGDPDPLTGVHAEVRKLIGQAPIFGICLGCQILTHAYGGKTFKLKFGHRGANQPVKDLRTGEVAITSQNHGFAARAETLPDEVEVTHLNLNDDTVEGLRSTKDPVFAVQYHPEAAPGPHDANAFFSDFARLMDQHR